jgi:RNA polymerase sigma factor (sigma-70 family)
MKQYFVKTDQGDFIPVEEVWHRMYPTLYVIAARMTGNTEEAKDKTSAALTEFLSRKEEFTEFKQAKIFLLKKVFDDCLEYLKQMIRDGKLRKELQYLYENDLFNLEHEILRAEVTRHLDQLIKDLPPQQKKIYEYNCQPEHLFSAQIAGELGISKATVRTTKKATLQKLQKGLKIRGLIPILIIVAIGIALYFLL